MKCSYFNLVFLLSSIFLLNACGSDSEDEEHPSFDLCGDWIGQLRARMKNERERRSQAVTVNVIKTVISADDKLYLLY
jgi:hypothetical protein